MVTIPPPLLPGDTVGIVCPAGYMSFEKAQTCITTLKEWGYKVKIGKTLGKQHHYFAGTDEERLTDLQTMLDDPGVKAVLCGRGGYGLSRIIDRLDFSVFAQNPKWIIGYSDITVLHSHIYTRYNIATLHSPMAAAFNDGGAENEFIKTLRKVISGEMPSYNVNLHSLNRLGVAWGPLVGGNLSLLAHLAGTSSAMETKGKILFIEDVGEYLYNVDRMMLQLKRTGMLNNLSGMIVGSFTEMKDTVIPFGQGIFDLIFDKVRQFDYPVCFGFPVGHTDNNYPLVHGIPHKLSINEYSVMFTQA
ncbi:MAG TPA: LD-carboxypeptidase [Chitinophagaceae bacterium]|nr:LD-carboxypeptidase [Chitinophagaceae bacterium]